MRKHPAPSTTGIDGGGVGWSRTGDRTVYETLLRDCTPFIKTVARRQGVSPNYIHDVAHETLLTGHRARRTYDPNRSFRAWLRTVDQRRASDGLRRQRRNGVV